MSKNWADDLREVSSELKDASFYLNSLAANTSFVMGETQLVKALQDVSASMLELQVKVLTALNSKLDKDFADSEQSSRNMLNAALAGIQVAKKEDKDGR